MVDVRWNGKDAAARTGGRSGGCRCVGGQWSVDDLLSDSAS